LPEYTSYLSIPGFAATTAVVVIAELGDLRRFDSLNQNLPILALTSVIMNLGSTRQPIRSVSEALARKILCRSIRAIASAARYHPNHINDYYQRKKQSPGAKPKKIIIAAVHRLIRILYFLVTHHQTYDYDFATRN
jgi:transposase